MLYDKDCVNLSAAFENPDELVTTLKNGYLYAKLIDGSKPISFQLCLKVSNSLSSLSISDLELKIEADCSNSL